MENTNKLTKTALEKRAFLGAILRAPKTYYSRLMSKLITPIKEQGLLKGLGQYIGKQFVPVGHVKGIQNRIAELTNELKTLGVSGASNAPKALARKRELAQEIKNLTLRSEALSRPGAYSNLASKAFAPGATMSERALALKELAKAGGHYGMEGLNMGFMWGYPAYGLYSAATAPEGEKGKALGRLTGELSGFLAGGPIGILPTIAGSNILAGIGESAGEGLGEWISPTSPYRKLVKSVFPEEKDYIKRLLPSLTRGGLMVPGALRAHQMGAISGGTQPNFVPKTGPKVM